jgi:hypothetical protein
MVSCVDAIVMNKTKAPAHPLRHSPAVERFISELDGEKCGSECFSITSAGHGDARIPQGLLHHDDNQPGSNRHRKNNSMPNKSSPLFAARGRRTHLPFADYVRRCAG